jgi:hypothetical protein
MFFTLVKRMAHLLHLCDHVLVCRELAVQAEELLLLFCQFLSRQLAP